MPSQMSILCAQQKLITQKLASVQLLSVSFLKLFAVCAACVVPCVDTVTSTEHLAQQRQNHFRSIS